MKKIFLIIFLNSLVGFTFFFCKKEEQKQHSTEEKKATYNFGVGPIQTKLELGNLDPALVQKGQKLFNEKCTACHKVEERYVGPSLKDVTKRRAPEWIMNMILDPMKMTQEDPDAKALLAEYLTQMTNQSVSLDDARAILEYFRQVDSK